MGIEKWPLFLVILTIRDVIAIDSPEPDVDVGEDLNELGASFPPLESPPVRFATENSTVITSQTGSTALVPCVINNIGDGMDWTLQIKYVQQRDAGLYECQVSSHPPTSIFIQLNVVEARAEIQGPSEKYLKPGSGLRLTCTVVQSTEPPSYVFWYHNNRMINYDTDRGINVTTELTEKTSTLTITSAATRHSGNYSCVPSNAEPASTYVHILNGENPAAMQHGGRGLSWLQCSPSSWLLLFSIVIMMC
ncbi:zwei Ig domain protein zig-8 isoform X2 [Aethina tumida]|uniref:zwei Ig domain protein zig-8 isoform X2 n=1 Tax=Aethina tumida TaxID=116153 RepID=UPI00096B10E0|nr:zwei Ig domain protein zig-8 isoform X2 [Aethina tumida]